MNHALLVWKYDAAAPGKFTIVRAATDMNTTLVGAGNTCATGTWGATHDDPLYRRGARASKRGHVGRR